MERHIRELHAGGLTLLIVEHAMHLVMRLCDPVIVLDHGAKIAEGAPGDGAEGPDRPRRLPGDVSDAGDQGAWPATARATSCAASTSQLEPGTITCLVGPNGAGKSTVLRAITGLLRPREGAIMLDGRTLSGSRRAGCSRPGSSTFPRSAASSR